ncbi:MAG: hypothetical protein KC656_29265 [Myxococcales bacterium]|nr:hypothetical protein [Myxococcales bacterium]MCB9692374.1 hypothetical protein [Alphaproteobacteria bacterium]
MSTKPKREFTIDTGKGQEVVRGRAVAVETARTLSAGTWRPIRVTRDDERMEMTFRRGELTKYGYYSHGKRP